MFSLDTLDFIRVMNKCMAYIIYHERGEPVQTRIKQDNTVTVCQSGIQASEITEHTQTRLEWVLLRLAPIILCTYTFIYHCYNLLIGILQNYCNDSIDGSEVCNIISTYVNLITLNDAVFYNHSHGYLLYYMYVQYVHV